MGIRPEHLSSEDNFEFAFSIKVEATEYLGGTRFVYGRTKDGQSVTAEIRSDTDPKLEETLVLSGAPSYIRIFKANGERLR